MDNPQEQLQAQQPTNPTPSQVNSSRKSIIIPLGLGILFVLITIGAYLLGTRQSQTVVQNQQNQVIPTSIPTPIPDETANWTTYKSTQLPENSLKAYSIKHPTDWNLKIDTDKIGYHKLTLSKQNHLITIFQDAFGGGGCIFEGEVPEGPYGDYRNKKYTQIESGIGTLRRLELDTQTNNPNVTTFGFCISTDGKNYGSPTHIGIITYEVPKNYNQILIDEMDKIIKTVAIE